jgi:hypothetical protein
MADFTGQQWHGLRCLDAPKHVLHRTWPLGAQGGTIRRGMWVPFPVSPRAQRCEGHAMMLRHGTKIQIKKPTRVLVVRWAGATCDRINRPSKAGKKTRRRRSFIVTECQRRFLQTILPFSRSDTDSASQCRYDKACAALKGVHSSLITRLLRLITSPLTLVQDSW